MASTSIDMMNEEVPEVATSSFTGNTIYASKLKKQKSSKRKWFGVCLRVAVVTSLVTLMGASITLGLEVMKLKSMETSCETSSVAALVKNSDGTYTTHCNGLVHDGDCYTLHTEKKSFVEANEECTKNDSQLPQNFISSWLKPHLANTWCEDGTVFTVDNNNVNDEHSERQYYCVKHLYTNDME
ncbi:C-type lectin-like EEV membrane phosphoglycoprotein [Hypsugopox virus]|nr:C-type lectin-like EEV membrane phosphoglycoprotein [Hypsugopox virus]